MPDEAVKQWKQTGSLYLWRYLENTRNYPGWHLSADDSFCQSFADLTGKMLAARWNSQKTLAVLPPTAQVLGIPNNRGGKADWRSAQSFLLKCRKHDVAADHFLLEESANDLIVSVGTQKLQFLNECILGILQGRDDYSINSDTTQLWFWRS